MALKDKVTDALNETRMLILGAQILLGFQFNATFQPGFDRLLPVARYLTVVGLGLMSAAVCLLIAPAPFHRLVENGRDTWRLVVYTAVMAELALFPFALCIGLDMFIVAGTLFGTVVSILAGTTFSLLAAVFWYGIEAVRRGQAGVRTMDQPHEEPGNTSLREKMTTMLTETRVILPGAQALLGFQFTAFLTEGFEKLPERAKLVHFASLGWVAVAIVLLMAPAAYHRLVAGGEERSDVVRFGSRAMLGSLVVLAFGLSGELYVVATKLGGADAVAIAAAAAALTLYLGLWFGYPLLALKGASPAIGARRRS